MTEALQQEIRTLRSLHNSERDPEGRVFAPLADAYRRAGQIPEAVRLLNEGLTRLPDFVPGHVVAAELYVEQGLAEEADLAARRALELDPDNVNALRSLLRVLEQKGADGEAAEVRDRLEALEPDFAAAATGGASFGASTAGRADSRAPASADDTLVLDAVDDGFGTLELGEAGTPAHSGDLDLDSLELAEPAGPAAFAVEEADALTIEPAWDLSDVAPDEPEPALPTFESPVGEEAPAFGLEATLEPEEEPVFDLEALAAAAVAGTEGEDDGQVSDIGLLAPDALESAEIDGALLPEEEPVFELAALAPDEPQGPEEPVLDMAALAPDEPEEPVLDMAALAPDEPEEPVLDMAALAPDGPDEPVLDMAALAPDEPEEPVLDMAALAPDEPEEPVLDMAALAPHEPEEPVLDMAALAPDEPEEPVLDMAALAPDEPDAAAEEELVVDLDALAPDTGPGAGAEDTVDIASLSPDEPDEIVIDMDALRPDGMEAGAEQEGGPAAELPAEEPLPLPGSGREIRAAEADAAPEGSEEAAPEGGAEADEEETADEGGAEDEDDGAEPVYTRTLAELYVKQGALARALGVLRHLHAADPTNRDLADRIAELEQGADAAGEQPPVEASSDRRTWRPEAPADEGGHEVGQRTDDEELESLARDLSEAGDEGHEVDTPFAWGEQEAEAAGSADGPTIRDYFDGLLSWEPGEER